MRLVVLSIYLCCQYIHQSSSVVISSLICQHKDWLLPALLLSIKCVFTAAGHGSALPTLVGNCRQINQTGVELILHLNCCCSYIKRAFGFLLCDLKKSPPCLLRTAPTHCVVSKLTAENRHNRTESVPVAEHTGTDNRLKRWLRSIKTTNFFFGPFQQSHWLSGPCLKTLTWSSLLQSNQTVARLTCHGCTMSLWMTFKKYIYIISFNTWTGWK